MTAIASIGHNTFPPYGSPLRNWEEFSWIRNKPQRQGEFSGLPFPLKLVPLAQHPKLQTYPNAPLKVLAYRLLSHLRFTTLLELKHVNRVCSDLAQQKTPADLGVSEREDALRIYCDEGGHALFVELLARKVESFYGVSSGVLPKPVFDQKLGSILSSNNVHPRILHHFFVSISETLVTKILRDIPYDSSVAPIVKEVISDHAADEACHSVYFRWYFPRLWHSLNYLQRSQVGRLLPELVWAFLGPDYDVDNQILLSLGLKQEEIFQILEETYPEKIVSQNVRLAAHPTLTMFQNAGVFEDPLVKEAFLKHNLFID